MPRTDHVRVVLMLYKGILKVHRGLPLECRALGDDYVKAEFRRHKDIPPSETGLFLEEWTNYYLTIAKQMSKRVAKQDLGRQLSEAEMESLKDEQISQLYELYQHATTPDDPKSQNKT